MSTLLAAGTRVRVKALYPPGHNRTPHYTRGREGVVVGIADHQPDPQALAYDRDGQPPLPVYRVRFECRTLWPDDQVGRDAVIVDLFEPWLEVLRELSMSGHDHAHPRAADLEDVPLSYAIALTDAVATLLQAKAVFSADEMRRTLEAIDSRSPADGARVVARAWADDGFRRRLLEDANAAAAALGIDAGGIPIRAIANRPGVHNVIVCTLCSCYPRFLLGPSPDWYKSRAYRSRVVREPRSVLAEFGLVLPEEVEVIVHDSTAELRYLVLPERPEGTAGWREEELAALVTRDCMIGTAVPRLPA